MAKKFFLEISIFILLILFTGCVVNDSDTLRICVDLEFLSGSDSARAIDLAMYDFEYTLTQTVGLTDYIVEYIPRTGADRETALDRLRTEIMSGGGPDVFIMHCAGGEASIPQGKALFLMPEKSMEIGLFLPLDEYIENAQYAEWDKFTPAVMEAGKNKEGQQLIPVTYALQAAMYRASDFSHTPTSMTWEEMLNSEELHDTAACLGDGFTMIGSSDYHMDYILGKLADYEQEELAFTEEELLHHVTTILDLAKYTASNHLYDIPNWSEGSLGVNFNFSVYNNRRSADALNGITTTDTLSLVPLYSDDGGCTAMILTYAAVNRNTQRPQDAFNVIDSLLSTHNQQFSKLFWEYIYRSGETSMSIHEDLNSKQYPVFRNDYLSDENFSAMSAVRDQITYAQFAGQLNIVLQNMMMDCWSANQLGEDYTNIVHKAYETMDRMMGE